jgi:ribosomal protein S6--L-glutamate ligase
MRIAVLSRNAALYSTSRLVLAGRARGHEVDVIDPLDLQLVVARKTPSLCYAGRKLPRYDAVIPRVGASINRYGMCVVRLFEHSAVVLNDAEAVTLSRDKVRSLGVLAAANIAVPRTVGMRGLAGLDEALDIVGGCPAIVKLQHGTHGVGTIMADSRKALVSLVEALQAMGQEIILQEYVRASRGRDVRVVVIGGKVVAAMRRMPKKGEFRSNLHRGASGEPIDPPKAYKKVALKAAKLIGLDVTGVDLLEGKDGPLVLELNSSPGLEGIEQISKVDVASAIIMLAERRCAKNTNRRGAREKWS